jgi:hypothetical protein
MWRGLAQLLSDRRMMPGLLHLLKLPLGILKLCWIQAAHLGRQRRPRCLQVMLVVMLGCRKFPFVLSHILKFSKEAPVLR